MKFDGSRDKGLAVVLIHALQVDQPVTVYVVFTMAGSLILIILSAVLMI